MPRISTLLRLSYSINSLDGAGRPRGDTPRGGGAVRGVCACARPAFARVRACEVGFPARWRRLNGAGRPRGDTPRGGGAVRGVCACARPASARVRACEVGFPARWRRLNGAGRPRGDAPQGGRDSSSIGSFTRVRVQHTRLDQFPSSRSIFDPLARHGALGSNNCHEFRDIISMTDPPRPRIRAFQQPFAIRIHEGITRKRLHFLIRAEAMIMEVVLPE